MSDVSTGVAPSKFDVVIVGAGVSGALVAKFLAMKNERAPHGLRVLILEAGDEIKPNNNEYLGRYYEATSKVPEAPYTPEIFKDKPVPDKGSTDRVATIAKGRRSDAKLRDPSTIKAGRPTVLSVSQRAWQEPNKGSWSDDDKKKCDPTNTNVNYFEQTGALPFASTYERIAGGTARHWMGITLRHLPNDFKMGQQYGKFTDRYGNQSDWPNWPLQYNDLKEFYARAEREIGVSGDSEVQRNFEKTFHFPGAETHGYPMPAIPLSFSDKELNEALRTAPVIFPPAGPTPITLEVTPLPVARNSEPFNRRRACAGNSSCIPVCPIQAKYDPTITLREAMNTGNLTIEYRAVACDIAAADAGTDRAVTHIEYIKYAEDPKDPRVTHHQVSARLYVLAANAIETPRLMLMSNGNKGIVDPKAVPVGSYLMDHPFYIASALATKPVFPYRGPLVTGGIEKLRDGDFRKEHAAFRVDVSNAGWSLTNHGTAQTLTEDFISGSNNSGKNPHNQRLAGTDLVQALHDILTKQVSLGFLVEQTPDRENRVTLSHKLDGLGLRRPKIDYDFSTYTKDGLAYAALLARKIFEKLGYERYPDEPGPGIPIAHDACSFEWVDAETREPIVIRYMGAGHIAGTCRMGTDAKTSVVDPNLKVRGINNLYVIGSAVFPTIGTANPTLTIAALSLRLADYLVATLTPAPNAAHPAAPTTTALPTRST